jgi:hypothetical protein
METTIRVSKNQDMSLKSCMQLDAYTYNEGA